MDRIIAYPQEQSSDTDLLTLDKAVMVSLASLIRAAFGTSTLVDGFACTPGTGLTVSVAAGAIFAQAATDATGYGSLGTDAIQIMKEGHTRTATVLSCPAPGTVGQSINYLIEVGYQDIDGGSTLLAYYDASNPSVPYSGPANDGIPQNTVRQGVAVLQVKAGTAAPTGTQTTPSPDSGFVALWDVTVDYGETSLTGGDIVQDAAAPFIPIKLTNPFTVPTQPVGDISNSPANTAFVNRAIFGQTNVSSAGHTYALADVGQTVRLVTGSGTQTFNIPANASVAFPQGSRILGIVDAGCTVSLTITTDSLYYPAGSLGGAGQTRTLTAGSYPLGFELRKFSAAGWILIATHGVT